MKRTLFNTMMGCLAALSLAGCGGSDSGGGSSTVPSESLISEGYDALVLRSDDNGKVSYGFLLESDGTCRFYLHAKEQSENLRFSFQGNWNEKFLKDGEFQITFENFSNAGISSEFACKIVFTSGPITLTIPNMREYRAGLEVTGSFDKAPFTHTAGTDCPDQTTEVGTGLKLQMGRW